MCIKTPTDTITRYCEDMFPSEYGKVIDFTHIYSDELPLVADKIIWLPEEPAELADK